ncbi:MAG: DUF1595 domain-containing protein, partial [Proteobacteria bacterium]
MKIIIWISIFTLLACGKAEKRDAQAVSESQSPAGTDPTDDDNSPEADSFLSSNAIVNADPKCVPEVRQPPLQRLTVLQYQNAVQELLLLNAKPEITLPSDDLVGPFAVNTKSLASQVSVNQYESAGESIAALAKPQMTSIVKCSGQTITEACLKTFVETFGAKALRRPLNEEEKARYLALAAPVLAATGGIDAALVVIRAFLTSPLF